MQLHSRAILVTVIMLCAIAQSGYADHTTQQRSSCRGLPKYKATAKIKRSGGSWQTSNDNGCKYALARINSKESNLPNCCDGNGDANACSEVKIGDGVFYATGWGRNGWAYGEDNDVTSPDFSFSPMIALDEQRSENAPSYELNGYSGDGIFFNADNRTVLIKNLTAYLEVLSADLKNDYSTLQFKLFTEDVIRGERVLVKTLWSAKATILNGELLLEGDFKQNEFVNKTEGEMHRYTLGTVTKEIPVAADVDFESLVLEMAGDGGNLGIGVSNKYAPDLTSADGMRVIENIKSHTEFNFDVVGDLTAQKININITKNTLNKAVQSATIRGLDGRLVKTIDAPPANMNHQECDIRDLPSGAYLFCYSINGHSHSKKFII